MRAIFQSVFLSLGLFFASTIFGASEVSDLGQPVDTHSFLVSLRGDYVIDLVNGEKPHDVGSAQGRVYADDEGGTEILAFSYCYPDHGCLNGPEIPYEKTQTFKKELGGGHVLHTMLTKLSTKTVKVEWETEPGKATLRQFDLKLSGVPLFNVVHVIRKNSTLVVD